jgi:hypothetical protein
MVSGGDRGFKIALLITGLRRQSCVRDSDANRLPSILLQFLFFFLSFFFSSLNKKIRRQLTEETLQNIKKRTRTSAGSFFSEIPVLCVRHGIWTIWH